MLILHSDYITCSSYFRLSVYTWGILLAYIRRRLLSRLRFLVFGKQGVTIIVDKISEIVTNVGPEAFHSSFDDD